MAFEAPDVYRFTLAAGSNAAQSLITALQTHWADPGASSKWTLSAGVAFDAGDTLCVSPDADPQGTYQVNLRRTSTTAIVGMLDPDSGITDAGATGAGPTGNSANSSHASGSEAAILTLASATLEQRVLLLEWPDSFMLLVSSTTPFTTWHNTGCMHAGRVYTPHTLGIPGMDGLGLLGPRFGRDAATTANWFSASGTATSRFRVGVTGTRATDWVQGFSFASVLTTAMVGGVYVPSPITLTVVAAPGNSTTYYLGTARRIYEFATARSNNVRLEESVSGTDRWIHLETVGSTTKDAVPWPDATQPLD